MEYLKIMLALESEWSYLIGLMLKLNTMWIEDS